MVDSLAIYDLFFRLTNNATLSNLQIVFEAASKRREPSFEYIVNALGDMFGAGSTITKFGNREQLHARIDAIRKDPEFTSLAGQLTLVSATGESAQTEF